MKRQFLITCDINNVCDNQMEFLLPLYNREYKDSLKMSDLINYNLEGTIKPECKNFFKEFGTDENIAQYQPQNHCMYVLDYLLSNKSIYLTVNTASHPIHMGMIFSWFKINLPSLNFEQIWRINPKQYILSDVIIDDCFDQLKDNNSKYKLLFTQPWNMKYTQDEEEENNIIRVDNWFDIETNIKYIFKKENI